MGTSRLGNRSIVAHPGLPDMKDVLNARIKHREWFRPFAPSILAERSTNISSMIILRLHAARVQDSSREAAELVRCESRGRYWPLADRDSRGESALL